MESIFFEGASIILNYLVDSTNFYGDMNVWKNSEIKKFLENNKMFHQNGFYPIVSAEDDRLYRYNFFSVPLWFLVDFGM